MRLRGGETDKIHSRERDAIAERDLSPWLTARPLPQIFAIQSTGELYEASSQRILSNPSITFLLWSGDPSQASTCKTRSSARRRSAPPARIPRTAITGRDAKTAEPQGAGTSGNMRHLPRSVYRLQRHRSGSQESQRNGRSVERRSSRQYPSNTPVVQWRKGINQNG
jgi:hypothetical protein